MLVGSILPVTSRQRKKQSQLFMKIYDETMCSAGVTKCYFLVMTGMLHVWLAGHCV